MNKPKPLKPSEVFSQRKWQVGGLVEAKLFTATKYKDLVEVSSGNFERIGPFVYLENYNICDEIRQNVLHVSAEKMNFLCFTPSV